MRLSLTKLSLLLFAVAPVMLEAQDSPTNKNAMMLMQSAQQVILNYHKDAPDPESKLRVVYFVPKDQQPLRGYADRLDRVMNDINEYFISELSRYGVATKGLPLERENGKLLLHVVTGKMTTDKYHHESGNRTREEIAQALKGKFDLTREHVLVFYALCQQEDSGRYIFDAPYYGGGSNRRGLCHAADCELLDPKQLTNTEQQIVYTEHYYPRVEESVAKFNTKYLGGSAHELGHGLGLPHDAGGPLDPPNAPSLMGGGNLHYRQEVWKGGPPTYLSIATALRLVANPLLAKSDRGRWDKLKTEWHEMKYDVSRESNAALSIHGDIDTNIPAFAVIAYVLPIRNRTDHGSKTYPADVKDGSFDLAIRDLKPDTYKIKIVSIHANGSVSQPIEKHLTVRSLGTPILSEPDHPAVRRAERRLVVA